jgi:hypothetical protein
MMLRTFLTFLAFLTRKLRCIQASQKTLPEIRREALDRRFAAEQTRSLLDGFVRAVLLRLVTTKTGSRVSHPWQGKPLLFSGGANARKVRKASKGGASHDAGHLSDLSDLSDTEAVFSGTCRRPLARLGNPTLCWPTAPVGFERDEFGRRPESASDTQCRPVGASRIGAAMPHGT